MCSSDLLSEDIAVYLPCALRAIRQGVNRAHFINYHTDGGLLTELFTHDGLGSMVSPAPLDRLRALPQLMAVWVHSSVIGSPVDPPCSGDDEGIVASRYGLVHATPSERVAHSLAKAA